MGAPRAPASMHIVALQAEAETIHNATDPNVRQQSISQRYMNVWLRVADENIALYQMQYCTTRLHIYELCLSDITEERERPAQVASRLNNMVQCSQALKAVFDAYFSFPHGQYFDLPFAVFGQFGHSLICLTKLASFEYPGWSLTTLPIKLDFVSISERAASQMEFARENGPDGEIDTTS